MVTNVLGDSASYCTNYDSAGVAAQAMVDAGGCSNELGFAITQVVVDEWVSNGCDWGSDTTSVLAALLFHLKIFQRRNDQYYQ